MKQRHDRASSGVALVFSLVLLQAGRVAANEDAKRLYDDLMENSGYDPLIRPVSNASEVLPVKLGVSLKQIIDVVRKNAVECHMYMFSRLYSILI